MNFIKQFFDYTASYSRSGKHVRDKRTNRKNSLKKLPNKINEVTNAFGNIAETADEAAKNQMCFYQALRNVKRENAVYYIQVPEEERKILSAKGAESISVETAEEIGKAITKGFEDGLQKPKKSFMESVFNELPSSVLPKTENKKNSYEKVFIEHFKQLTYTRRASEVWTDFVTMFACAISNAVDKEDKIKVTKRENMYLQAINKYSKDEQQIFPQLSADVTMALEENPEQDFLGRIYSLLGLYNKDAQQFFTPYHVCELMAEVTLGNVVEDVKNRGHLSINDPCCGAGATLIAALNVAKKKLQAENMNFQEKISFVAQDIDYTVAMMCYIQLSLLGVCGYVKVGNSLTDPIIPNDNKDQYWFTPMYFSDIWYYRRIIDKWGPGRLVYRVPNTSIEAKVIKENGTNGQS